MLRKAVVADIGQTDVWLLMLDEVEKAHEEACHQDVGCGSSGCGCRVSGRRFRAAKPADFAIKPGDTVEVSSPAGLGASLLILGIPVVGATAVWFVITRFFPNAAEGFTALGAFLGAIIAGGLAFIPGSRRGRKRLPEIVATVESGSTP